MSLFRDNILSIISELNQHKNKNKQELMTDFVHERLKDCNDSFYNDLMLNKESLLTYNELRVLKKLSKETKKNV